MLAREYFSGVSDLVKRKRDLAEKLELLRARLSPKVQSFGKSPVRATPKQDAQAASDLFLELEREFLALCRSKEFRREMKEALRVIDGIAALVGYSAARSVDDHYLSLMSVREIAKARGVSKSKVALDIKTALDVVDYTGLANIKRKRSFAQDTPDK